MTTNDKTNTENNLSHLSEIGEGLYQIRLPLGTTRLTNLSHVNSYLIKGTDGWVMIDTGWYSGFALETLENALNSIQLEYRNIKTIIVTHSHPDHFGMAGRIKHLSPNTQMLMHRWEADLIESRYIRFSEPQQHMIQLLQRHGVKDEELILLSSASMPTLEFVAVTLPDHMLYGGEIIETGIYNLEVIWTPGHSPGHICLYEPQNKILFSGDHVLPTISPNISFHVLSGDDPLGDYLYALTKLKHLPVSRVYPGHQSSFANIRERIESTRKHHENRQEDIRKIIDKGYYDAYHIASKISWSGRSETWDKFPPLEKRFALTETIAHLEHMRWEGKVNKIFRDDKFLYSSLD